MRWSDPAGEQRHGDDGDDERQRRKQVAVDVVPERGQRQTERQHGTEQHAASDRAAEGPAAEDDGDQRDESAAADDRVLELADGSEYEVGRRPCRR